MSMVKYFELSKLFIIIIYSHNRVSKSGFSCPRCGCKVCSIPSDCPICQLTLISSSHLARSYHHLFPISSFVSFNIKDNTEKFCFGCSKNFKEDLKEDIVFKCEQCLNIFCSICDSYIHGSLHNCPGCLVK